MLVVPSGALPLPGRAAHSGLQRPGGRRRLRRVQRDVHRCCSNLQASSSASAKQEAAGCFGLLIGGWGPPTRLLQLGCDCSLVCCHGPALQRCPVPAARQTHWCVACRGSAQLRNWARKRDGWLGHRSRSHQAWAEPLAHAAATRPLPLSLAPPLGASSCARTPALCLLREIPRLFAGPPEQQGETKQPSAPPSRSPSALHPTPPWQPPQVRGRLACSLLGAVCAAAGICAAAPQASNGSWSAEVPARSPAQQASCWSRCTEQVTCRTARRCELACGRCAGR